MISWVLIILITVGALGRGGGMVGAVPGFRDQAECKRAGETAKVALGGTLRDVQYVCVVQSDGQLQKP